MTSNWTLPSVCDKSHEDLEDKMHELRKELGRCKIRLEQIRKYAAKFPDFEIFVLLADGKFDTDAPNLQNTD